MAFHIRNLCKHRHYELPNPLTDGT
ncbi:hypothetical protein SPHINGO361_130158 [Sphingomonas sp. EC-HK361]|nr:hypothetical protein SPHINGO361_130158 [Sphingomonas sp. EC-HK361]